VVQYGFYLDADNCIGCATCVLACKDKHGLHGDVFWRRVAEQSGGGYTRDGDGYRPNVYAWYVTQSCNHCRHPACIRACPAGAIAKREEDGLVIVSHDECMGCRECLPACPYDALHFELPENRISKCDGCLTLRKINRLPECVTACPMRVLDFGPLQELQKKYPHAGWLRSLDETGPSFLLKLTGKRGVK
jgi:anaerobic dimethyl sulfoxide reductase subunit B